MSDNLKLIEERVDTDIDPNGAPGSILGLNHNEILKEVLNKTGKYTGSPYIAKKDESIVPTGIFSWNGNVMNDTNQFTITVSKLTTDLNDFTDVLDTLTTGSVIRFKDYVGRSVYLDYISFEPSTDANSNEIYNIEVKGRATNPNYIYQDAEQQICVLEVLIRAIGYDDIYSANFFKGTYSHSQNYEYTFQHFESYIKPELFQDLVTQLVTLSAGDPTFDRFDRVTWRNDEQFHVIPGTPSADPFPEDYDEENEISVVVIRVTANTTAPPDVNNELVYLSNLGEPTEWDAVGTANVDPSDIGDSQSGATSILFSGATISDEVVLTNDALLNGSDISNFSFWVKPINVTTHRFRVRFYNGNTRVSNSIYFSNGTFGFDSSNLNWQLITLDLASLGISGDQFDNIRIRNRRSGATIRFDNMNLQSGLPVVIIPQETPPPVQNSYPTTSSLISGQVSQTKNYIQYVSDASGDPTIQSGYAYYEYLGTTNGDLTDYRKLSTQETLDLIFYLRVDMGASNVIDWGAGGTFTKTLTGVTTLSDSNLPQGILTRDISLHITGDFPLTFPATWTLKEGIYVGTKSNQIVVECVNGNAGFEFITYTIIPDA